MEMIEFKVLFREEFLPELFLYRTDCYIGAIKSGNEADAIEDFWDDMIKDFYCDDWLGENNFGPLCKRDEETGDYTSIPVARKDELQAFIERVIEIYKAGE